MTDSQRADLIIRTASRLPIEERRRLAKKILEREDALPQTDSEEMLWRLIPIAEQVVGHPMRYTRNSIDVKIRSFVSYFMWKKGQAVTQIALAFGMNHTTVINYVNKVKDYFDVPVFYAKEIEEYVRFKELAEEKEKEVRDGKE